MTRNIKGSHELKTPYCINRLLAADKKISDTFKDDDCSMLIYKNREDMRWKIAMHIEQKWPGMVWPGISWHIELNCDLHEQGLASSQLMYP